MPQTFYHGSIIPEIHTLEPRSLYHGGLPKEHHPTDSKSCPEKVLYLTTSIPYALVYLWDRKKTGSTAKWVTCGIRDGVPVYEEQFPDQLQAFYQGVFGYLYEVKSLDVLPMPHREQMYYSRQSQPVHQTIYIADVYAELLRYEKLGLFRIRRFSEQPKEIQEELTQRVSMYIQQKKLLREMSEEAHFMKRYFAAAWKLAESIEKSGS